jgi:hypothetical protein
LFAVGIYQAHFPGADALVYPVIAQVCCSGYALFSLLRPRPRLHMAASSGAVTNLRGGPHRPETAGGKGWRDRAVNAPPCTRPT